MRDLTFAKASHKTGVTRFVVVRSRAVCAARDDGQMGSCVPHESVCEPCFSRRSLHRFRVRLLHKIRKLFSTDTLASLWEHAARWSHPVDAKRILATIDAAEIARIAEYYPRRPGARKTNAWQDAAHWIDINVGRAQNLWLDRSPPLRILDLGSGAGYFLYVCRLLGHSGLGLDLDDDPFFGAMTKYFNVPRVIWRIDPSTPLPDLGETFDLVTGHRVCFHRIEIGRASCRERVSIDV